MRGGFERHASLKLLETASFEGTASAGDANRNTPESALCNAVLMPSDGNEGTAARPKRIGDGPL